MLPISTPLRVLDTRVLDAIPRRYLRAASLLLIVLALLGSVLSLGLLTYALPSLARPVAPAPVDPAALRPGAPQWGVAFPRWSTTGYGAADREWTTGVAAIRQGTGAGWVQLVIQLYGDDASATTVHAGPWTSSPAMLAAGIALAHRQGLRVFVVPHLVLVHSAANWGGQVHFDDPAAAQAWFASYWQALAPYVAAAARAGADELAVGTELSGLESAPAALWQQLLAQVHAVFLGTLIYNMDHGMLGTPPPTWMRDPLLSFVGVSLYESLVPQPMPLTAQQLQDAWRTRILPKLDALSAAVGKPVLLSEVGYRNSTDALYQPWVQQTAAAPDPQLQADAYAAAVQAVQGDPHLAGLYFWALSGGQFTPSDAASARLLNLFAAPATPARSGAVHG
jgi:hypothetical protein